VRPMIENPRRNGNQALNPQPSRITTNRIRAAAAAAVTASQNCWF